MSRDGHINAGNGTIRFIGGYRPEDIRQVCKFFNELLIAKPKEVVFNFQECTDAFPNSMLPAITMASKLRDLNYSVYAFLPKNPYLSERFHKTNWAHYLSPTQYPLTDDISEPHLAVHRYSSSDEHYKILRGIIDLIWRTIVTPQSSVTALEWVLSELMDNVLNHSDSTVGGFAQLAVFEKTKKLAFCVSDAGKGILSSLQEAYPQLKSDRVAIQEAVRSGVTRNKDAGQGNGLSGSLSLATRTGGWFRVVSGRSEVAWLSTMPQNTDFAEDEVFYGTVIDIQLPYGQEIDVGSILTEASHSPNYSPVKYSPTSLFETRHLSEDGASIVLKMADETIGFGTRPTGGQMRLKALNFLRTAPELPLVIDWAHIPIVASSYADEFLGKLFVELGPVGFNSRIRLINLDPVVQTLINRAIMQRTLQVMSGRN